MKKKKRKVIGNSECKTLGKKEEKKQKKKEGGEWDKVKYNTKSVKESNTVDGVLRTK